MADVILIHGIAQEQRQADDLEAEWVPALAGGVRAAGYPDLADRLWRGKPNTAGVDVRMAAYGDIFLREDRRALGADIATGSQARRALATGLATEWVDRAASRDGNPDQLTAINELAYSDTQHEEQGAREEALRAILNSAARLKWFAPFGWALAERFVNTSLWQVTAYLVEPHYREQIQERVLRLITSETRVIIGHSLGSIIAYEIAAAHLAQPLPLLLTLGSPLGLRTIVYEKVQPQPPVYPRNVARWVNIADRNDLVAAQPILASLFQTNMPATALLESSWTVDNGAKPHQCSFYLTKAQVGRPVADALG